MAETERPDTSKRKDMMFGAVFVVAGLAMMVFIAIDQTGLNAPLWLAEAAAACFAVAGLSVISRSLGHEGLARLFGLLVVYLLVLPGFWIGLFSDGSGCSVSIVGPVSVSGDAGAFTCRAVFGAGAVVTLLCALAFTWAVLRRKSGAGEPGADRSSRI